MPEVPLAPDHDPLALHEVALVLDQLKVDEPPDATLAGDAASDTVGASTTDTVAVCAALPPVPVHVSV